jgi:hypothetical protein
MAGFLPIGAVSMRRKAVSRPRDPARGALDWLLVTSAWRMPRTVGCFRRSGFPLEAYPVDWHTLPRMQPTLSGKFTGGHAGLDAAVHEWLGLLAYWITGANQRSFSGTGPRTLDPPGARIAHRPDPKFVANL